MGRRFLPLRAGRVNDKKVNEENSNIRAERGGPASGRGEKDSCIQGVPLGYNIPLFAEECKSFFAKNRFEST